MPLAFEHAMPLRIITMKVALLYILAPARLTQKPQNAAAIDAL